MKKKLLFFSLLLFTLNFNSRAADITAIGETGIVVKRWDLPSTWNLGRIPNATDNVIIPSTAEVSIGIPNVTVYSIEVAGKLSVVNTLATLNLKTRYMMIMGTGASFTWGTEASPYLGTGTLTLTGQTITDLIPGTTNFSKGIMVMDGGILDIHGKPKTSWTHLGITANAGATTFTLAADLAVAGWAIGDSLVVSSTDYDNNHAEKLKIANINLATKLVTLDDQLNWKHFGQKLFYGTDTKGFDQRAEVGLISRNITIQGEFIAGTAVGYGGYIMSMEMSTTRIENISLFNMGQNGNKGSYPMHWHLAGNRIGSYIKSTTIRNSFNRGVVLHGTDNVLVENNMLYQHRGHGYMLEDGDEENNTFKDNLGISTSAPRVGFAVEASEMSPATYWITNPNNTFDGNVAAGSVNAGFWIIPVSKVMRPNSIKETANSAYSPRKFKLKNFTDNVAHTCRVQNLSLEGNMTYQVINNVVVKSAPLFDPIYPDLDVNNITLKHVFNNFTSYKGAQNGVWTRAGVTSEFIGCYFGDASFMAFLSYNGVVRNSYFAALTLNTGSGDTNPATRDKPNLDDILGFQMYNGSTDLFNVHFAGFNDPSKAIGIGNRQSSGKFPNFTATNLTFQADGSNTNLKKVDFGYKSITEDPARSILFVAGLIDLDGSLTGTDGARITPRIYNTKPTNPAYDNRIFDSNFNLPKLATNFVLNANWSAYITTNTRYGILQNLAGWGMNPLEPGDPGYQEDKFGYLIRSDGAATFDQFLKGYDCQLPIILEEKNSTGVIRPDIIYSTQYHELPNRVLSRFQWTTNGANTIAAFLNVPTTTKVYIGTKPAVELPSVLPELTKVSSLATLQLPATGQAYAVVDNTLYIKYIANQNDPGVNTSGISTDFSSDDIHIDFNAAGTNTGLQNFVTLADFSVGIDNRGVRAASPASDVVMSTVTNVAGTNRFTLKKGPNAVNDFIDYNFTLDEKQVWREFNKITLNYQGPIATVMVRENSTSNWIVVDDLPVSNTLTTYDLSLAASAIKGLAAVAQVKLRFLESNMGAGITYEVKLDKFTLSLAPATVNINLLSASPSPTLILNQSLLKKDINIYPNPANGVVTISLGTTLTDLNIYDLSGEVVYTRKSVKGDLSIPTSDIGKAGVYVLKTDRVVKKLIIVN